MQNPLPVLPPDFRWPEGFRWGASTSAHQTEGGNVGSDWWNLEHLDTGGLLKEPSHDACDSYHRWHEDMDLLAELGFSDYRFSVEWARIEPAPGAFSQAAIAHYRRMVDGALARGLRPMVTLHHFTSPQWFAERGGWSAPDAADLFERYVRAAAPLYTDGVEHLCTINEPNILAVMTTVRQMMKSGTALPGAGLPLPDHGTTEGLLLAHRQAVSAVKSLAPDVHTGWSVACQGYEALAGAAQTAEAHRRPREDVFLEAAREDDWLGVQSYTRTLIGPDGPLPVPEGAERTLTGWEYFPEAVGRAVRHATTIAPGVPLIVTENGIATGDDSRRTSYTAAALEALAEAVHDGADVRGYFHWSLLDNYEWGSYDPTFGLVAVDRTTFRRTPKPSARWLGALNPARTAG